MSGKDEFQNTLASNTKYWQTLLYQVQTGMLVTNIIGWLPVYLCCLGSTFHLYYVPFIILHHFMNHYQKQRAF